MKLPHADDAIVPPEKITGYILSPFRPDGRTKAAFFRRFGFRRDEPQVLEQALLQVARTAEMTEIVFRFGRRYVGTGLLSCPDGRQVRVLTVWVLRDNLPPPLVVTAYPAL